MPTSDIFGLHDVIKYAFTREQPVHFKVLLRHVLTHSGHSDAVMTLSENVTSEPNVLHDREWHPWTANLAETGLLLPCTVW